MRKRVVASARLRRAERKELRRRAWAEAQAAPFTERRQLYERRRDELEAEAYERPGR